eukprot:5576551-Prymnesium_polylepis.1
MIIVERPVMNCDVNDSMISLSSVVRYGSVGRFAEMTNMNAEDARSVVITKLSRSPVSSTA